MKIVDFSISRPVSVFIFSVAAVVFGVVAFRELAVDLLPDITGPNRAAIRSPRSGDASPRPAAPVWGEASVEEGSKSIVPPRIGYSASHNGHPSRPVTTRRPTASSTKATSPNPDRHAGQSSVSANSRNNGRTR